MYVTDAELLTYNLQHSHYNLHQGCYVTAGVCLFLCLENWLEKL